jgi:parvulin-like peptidyl-prolyl isomerase
MKLCRRFYSMRTRRVILFIGLAAVAATVLAACGATSKPQVPSGDVAVVGSVPVTQTQYDFYWAQAKLSYAKQKPPKAFPAVGSSKYEALRNELVSYLVRRAATEQEAADMGIKVTDADVQSSLNQVIKTNYTGSKSKYEAALRKEHLTDQAVRDEIRANLISQRLYTALIDKVSVSSKEIKDYYSAHKSSYEMDVSRNASHILVKTKAQAESIYKQLKAGGNFAKLAKKYSIDTGTKSKGGALGATEKKSVVKPFADVLFKLKTGTYSQPVRTQYGWHIIEATGPIVPPHLQPLKDASSTIEQTLLQAKQQQEISNWAKQTDKFVAAHTSYAKDYAPPTTTSSSAVATTTTQ